MKCLYSSTKRNILAKYVVWFTIVIEIVYWCTIRGGWSCTHACIILTHVPIGYNTNTITGTGGVEWDRANIGRVHFKVV